MRQETSLVYSFEEQNPCGCQTECSCRGSVDASRWVARLPSMTDHSNEETRCIRKGLRCERWTRSQFPEPKSITTCSSSSPRKRPGCSRGCLASSIADVAMVRLCTQF